jgi:primosomal protein N' (replication factor Y)
MVSKGYHFANVSVAGILNADTMMNIPDFRAYERAFQLMFQVSGCAVRNDRQGCVIVQTLHDENELLTMIRKFDYRGMAQTQLQERHQFHYPPYIRLIMLVLRSMNETVLDEIAELYVQQLRAKLGGGVSGPVLPPVTRVHALFVRKIMLKIELSSPVSGTRKILEEVQSVMQQNPHFKQVILHYDVDPQ